MPQDRARVLLATYSAVPSPDAQGVLVENMILALGVRYDLDVLSIKAGDLPYVGRLHGARMLRVPLGDGSPQQQVETFRRALDRQLDSGDYDVIHVRSGWAALPVCRRRSELQARVVLDLTLSVRAMLPPADRDFYEWSLAQEDGCLGAADVVLVADPAGRDHLAGRGCPAPVEVVRPGVNVDLFDWEPSPGDLGPLVAYVGRLGPGRGLRTLLSAFRLVASEVPARLLFVGPVAPGFGEVLETSVRRLGLTDRVVTLGPVAHQDIPRVLAGASVCVLPGVAKRASQPLAGVPLALLEYLACSRPAVVAAGRFSAALEASGPCLLTVAKESAEALADTILVGLRNPPAELVSRGYRLVRDAWTASGARRSLLEVYRRLAPYGPPAKALVSGLPGQPPPRLETTTARRFADLHDTIVQRPAPGTAPDAPEVLDVTNEVEILEEGSGPTRRT